MKYILLIPTGLSDEPIPGLEGKTPLEQGITPNLDFLAKGGRVGTVQNTPAQFYPGTDVTCLSVLGYNPEEFFTGRGALEAAELGVKLDEDEVAFRLNFVTIDGGILVDYNGGHITSKESLALINFLNKKLANDHVRFVPGLTYRHLAIFRAKHGYAGLSAVCEPPHIVLGKPCEEHFPKGAGEELLAHVMRDSFKLLREHEVNQVRLDLKENPGNMIWLWGQGVQPKLPKFGKRFGLKGAMIAAVNLVRGLGRVAGLDVLDVEGATGYVNTDYAAKGEAALRALEKYDFVCVHLEAADEAGHEGDAKLKMNSIEQFDRYIVGPLRKYAEAHRDVRIWVVPDHGTSCLKKAHMRDPAPFLMYGAGIPPDEVFCYSEATARYSAWTVARGHELMDAFIGSSVGAGLVPASARGGPATLFGGRHGRPQRQRLSPGAAPLAVGTARSKLTGQGAPLQSKV